MNITKSTTINQVRASFTTQFPYLALEFYRKPHDHFHGSRKKDQMSHDLALGELNPAITSAVLRIDGSMSVDKLETYFEEDFGLHVQVFRKSGDQWLQTSVTDDWTLDQQNNKAAEQESYSK